MKAKFAQAVHIGVCICVWGADTVIHHARSPYNRNRATSTHFIYWSAVQCPHLLRKSKS